MSHALAMPPAVSRIRAETPADAEGVEALVMAAFGPGRFSKTAERLREGSAPSAGFVAHVEGRVIGSVRLWPVRVGPTPALFLGPIAVDAGRRSDGLGAELIAACLDHARTLAGQVGGVLLVGDRAYFERFGFVPAPEVVLPGPVDRRRILWLATGAPTVSGAVAIGR
ncbi:MULTISPECIES: GNAT family N-acetyltransferase [unclassified Brevundimonas]|uniref:GNAT family N-acetyltransferase n=1 Tax=unclassified Brevundimonas TaxID=2622653 RepID=UPI000E8F9E8B|nr:MULTISPECIES: N-acetyltransferase [unclassified Brevundimonas]MCK6105092.1 N-acetyltransferase [Brevundimonas sp. EYE_349]HBI18966.1 N-acetyltransferase [Brevundimonas sp.]